MTGHDPASPWKGGILPIELHPHYLAYKRWDSNPHASPFRAEILNLPARQLAYACLPELFIVVSVYYRIASGI